MRKSKIEKMLAQREIVLTADYNAALDMANFDVRHTVLDVATGSGRMLEQLVLRGHQVISGDIDPKALDKAQERLGNLANRPTLVILNAHEMQFDNGSFCAVTLANAIHEMNNPRSALDEIARVMTDDGKLLITEFNSTGFELMELHHQVQGRGEHPKGEMSTEEIDSYLRSLFHNVETREFSITYAWVAFAKKIRRAR